METQLKSTKLQLTSTRPEIIHHYLDGQGRDWTDEPFPPGVSASPCEVCHEPVHFEGEEYLTEVAPEVEPYLWYSDRDGPDLFLHQRCVRGTGSVAASRMQTRDPPWTSTIPQDKRQLIERTLAKLGEELKVDNRTALLDLAVVLHQAGVTAYQYADDEVWASFPTAMILFVVSRVRDWDWISEPLRDVLTMIEQPKLAREVLRDMEKSSPSAAVRFAEDLRYVEDRIRQAKKNARRPLRR